MAPQAAKLMTSVRTAGCARRKERAAKSSLVGGRDSIVLRNVGKTGASRRYAVVRRVERRFCATIICGPE